MEGGRWKVEGGRYKVESARWKVAGTPGSPCPGSGVCVTVREQERNTQIEAEKRGERESWRIKKGTIMNHRQE